uniref:F-BAR domain only protein 1-like n=1 Tax=Sphaeramia orbicularis TaxID=375764 RepID=A0A672ZKH1_9TELE
MVANRLYLYLCNFCIFVPWQGEKNAGFDVLYHNMKHGQLATKELAEFVRERAAIEETYSKSMSKLAKMASNGSPQGTFAPMWDVFRVSSDKLALCHLELMRKMNDLIRDINKYGDEQVKIHRKTKEEMVGTVEVVQVLQVQSGHLQKSKEGYHAKCLELDRLRKEGAPQKEVEKAELKSKKAAESFALCIEKYNRVGGEFEQKMSESAQKFQEIEETHLRQMKQLIKGYSHSIEDTHVQVGQVHEEFKQNVENIGIDNLIQKFAELKGTGKDRPALVCFEEYMTALAPEGGKKSRAKAFRIPGLGKRDKEPDSTGFSLTLFFLRCAEEKETNFYSSDSDFDDEEPKKFHIQIRPVASSNRSSSAATEKELKATVGALTLPPNRGARQQVGFTDSEQNRYRNKTVLLVSVVHLSRGPSPISLSTQEAWPVAAAITEYINAYFKGGQHNRCLVKITGDLTMSFPAGITRIFTANPNVPVLSFRLVNISRIDHFLPNQKLLYSDPSQSDPDTRDFWFNMQALQIYLQREADLNPQASYYNVGLLKYQVSSQDPGRAPLLLSAECQRSGTVTRVSLDYHCCPATAPSTQLTAVQVLLPLDHTATDLQCQPPAVNAASFMFGILCVLSWVFCCPSGSGTLCASWQCLEVPRGSPPSLAVQFVGSGASLSGMDVELVGSRYRMSLVKKRFATGNDEEWEHFTKWHQIQNQIQIQIISIPCVDILIQKL